MKYSRALMLALFVAFGAVSPIHGQTLNRRSGLWISGGVDVAYATVDCRVCNPDGAIGPVGTIQIGGSPANNALLAMEFSYWRASGDSVAQDYALGLATLRFYPVAGSPLYLLGGFGIGRYGEEQRSPTGGIWALSAHGFTFQAGGGYEFPLSARLSAGPAIRVAAASSHQAKFNQLGESNNMSGLWLRVGMHVTRR